MKYRDPKTGNLELFPILNIDSSSSIDNLIISVIAECNKIFSEHGIEPIDTLDEIPKTFQLYNEKVLKECNTALENKKVAPVENLDKLAEAINEIIPYMPPALLDLKEDISFTFIRPTPVSITDKFVPITTNIILS